MWMNFFIQAELSFWKHSGTDFRSHYAVHTMPFTLCRSHYAGRQKTQESTVVLDLCLRKKSHDYCAVIVFEKLRF